ncbi:MAG: DUF4197 domain-containing protein [Flavobacteriaceae bacterium]|nr:DUF4197 domain-containing protein [Flavobacteriaceae bacterium]
MKITKTFLIAAFAAVSVQSCDSQAGGLSSGTANSLAVVQQILTASTNQGFSILGNTDSFLTNALIEAVIPEDLKKINTNLQNLGLSSLVEKEKQYIGQAAVSSVAIAKPIVTQAIQEITISDAIGIATGGKGAATEYLKNKTQSKLIAAIQPQVESQLQANGITSLINNAAKGTNLLNTIGSIFGKSQTTSTDLSSSISQYASEQIVNGLFEVSKDYEKKNTNANVLGNILSGVLGGTSQQ